MIIQRFETSLFLSKDKQFLTDKNETARSVMKMHNGKPCYHAIGLEWKAYKMVCLGAAKKKVCVSWDEHFECNKWDEVSICTNWELIKL